MKRRRREEVEVAETSEWNFERRIAKLPSWKLIRMGDDVRLRAAAAAAAVSVVVVVVVATPLLTSMEKSFPPPSFRDVSQIHRTRSQFET